MAKLTRVEMRIRGIAIKTRKVSSQEPLKHTASATTTDTVASSIVPSLIPVPCNNDNSENKGDI